MRPTARSAVIAVTAIVLGATGCGAAERPELGAPGGIPALEGDRMPVGVPSAGDALTTQAFCEAFFAPMQGSSSSSRDPGGQHGQGPGDAAAPGRAAVEPPDAQDLRSAERWRLFAEAHAGRAADPDLRAAVLALGEAADAVLAGTSSSDGLYAAVGGVAGHCWEPLVAPTP